MALALAVKTAPAWAAASALASAGASVSASAVSTLASVTLGVVFSDSKGILQGSGSDLGSFAKKMKVKLFGKKLL